LDWLLSRNILKDVKAIFSSPKSYNDYEYNLESMEDIVKISYFDKTFTTVIYIHGFLGGGGSDESINAIKSAYLQKGNHNFITIDWSLYAKLKPYIVMPSLPYYEILDDFRLICDEIAVQLKKIYIGGYKNFHLVGHSLGAQCAGIIGRQLKKISNNKFIISRIYALDPASPEFEGVYIPVTVSLKNIEKSDAEYVQIIHTNGNLYGLKNSYGHSDFYPNGGMSQPECLLNICSHTYARELFQESIRNETRFLARNCDSFENFLEGNCDSNELSYMGYSSKQTLPFGEFYLKTKNLSVSHEIGRRIIDGFRRVGTPFFKIGLISIG
jgi:pimeloyl-ACP methyl ester carboxylesterase